MALPCALILASAGGCAITSRMDEMNARMAKMSRMADKLDEMNRRMAELSERAASMDKSLTTMDRKLETMEKIAVRLSKLAFFPGFSAAPPQGPYAAYHPSSAAYYGPPLPAAVEPKPWSSGGLSFQPASSVNACDRRFLRNPAVPADPSAARTSPHAAL
jgi:hypothetical protein